MPHQVISDYARERFNALPSIELANETMNREGKLKTALENIGPLFLKHCVHDHWGLSLLHRHWRVQSDEVPLQIMTKASSPREFEMTPSSECGVDAHPSIIAIGKEQSPLQPMEFSNDSLHG